MNEELTVKLDNLIEAVTTLVQKVDEQEARLNELDSVLYDGLIGPANDAIAQNEYDNALSDFRTKYSEKLEPLSSAAKAIEGDDSFDIYQTAFDEYNNGDYNMSPDEFVNALTSSLSEQIAKIKEVVAEEKGISEDQVDVDVNAENGEITVDVDDKTTEEKPEDNDESAIEKDVATDTETIENDESLEDYENSLKKIAADEKDKSWIRG